MNIDSKLGKLSPGAVFEILTNESAFLSIALMAGNVVAYGYQMAMSRMLTPAEYGVVTTLTAVSYVLAVIMRTFQGWVIKATSDVIDGKHPHPRAVLIAAARTLVPLGICVFALVVLTAGWTSQFLQIDDITPITMLGLFAFCSILLPMVSGLLLGLGRLRAAGIVAIMDPLFRLLAGITFILGGLGASGALAAFAAGNIVAFAIAMLPLRPSLKRPRDDSTRFGSLDRYTLLSLIANISLMTLGSIDQIAVKHYFSEEVAGNYAVAFILGRIILNTTIALSWVVFARSATMQHDDSFRRRFLAQWMIVIGGLAAAPTVVYVLLPELAVFIFGGAQYDTAVSYVGLVGLEMTLFSLVYVQAFYQMSIKRMALVWPLFLGMALEIVVLALFHANVQQILLGLICILTALLIWISILSRQALRSVDKDFGAID